MEREQEKQMNRTISPPISSHITQKERRERTKKKKKKPKRWKKQTEQGKEKRVDEA